MSAPTLPGVTLPPLGLNLDVPVWGVDPSSQTPAVTSVGPGDRVEQRLIRLPGGNGEARRLHANQERLVSAFRDLRRDVGDPVYVLVEEPFTSKGRGTPALTSFFHVAIILAALAEVLPEGIIDTIGPTAWKKPALGEGHGAAGKPEILAWARDVIAQEEWCASCDGKGLKCKKQGTAHDLADSAGIATAAALRYVKGNVTW